MTKRKMYVFATALAVAGIGVALFKTPVGMPLGKTTGSKEESPSKVPGVQAAASPEGQTPTARGTLPYVLTSATPFTEPLRQAAEAQGARTVGILSDNRLLVEADEAARARLARDSRFAEIAEFSPSGKIQPKLAALISGGAKSVDVSLISLAAEDREIVIACLESGGGSLLRGCINEGDTIRANLPADLVAELATRGDVRWMETFTYPKLTNDRAVEPRTMNVQTVWSAPNELTGEGQYISTSDTGIDTGNLETLHEDLRDRLLGFEIATDAYGQPCYDHDQNGHGTHTAGSIVGTGAKSNGKIRGTAYGAHLYAWFSGGKDGGVYTPPTLEQLYRNDGLWDTYIHSASWGSNVNGEYTTASAEHDRYVWEHPEFLPVFAAGNEGSGRSTVGSPASSKNVLTVGATQNLRLGHDGGWGNGDPTVTAEFSSRGPCLDGRIKPDVAAPGVGVLSTRSHGVNYSYGIYDEFYAYDSGTSMACPLTAGAVAIVRQWLVERKGFADEDGKRPTAALMKAVIMGGAKDASVPNKDQGWGRVDLGETLFPTGGRAVKLIDRIPFAQDFATNIIIETTATAPLDVQLVWVDYPGSYEASQSRPKLVNDIDLTVEARVPGEPTFRYGNGGTTADTLNNAESVHIDNAVPTKYVITVDCKKIVFDHTQGGAAALYIRGAFDPDAEVEEPAYVHLRKRDRNYMSLDRALEAVRDDDETVEILDWVNLDKSVTLTNSCTIAATNTDATISYIARPSGAMITIATNATVTLSNAVFAASTDSLISVMDGGCLKLGPLVNLGVDYDHVTVSTANTNGFELAGLLSQKMLFRCAASKKAGGVFGTYSCDPAVAELCATNIVCMDDIDRETRGGTGPNRTLVWKHVDVPLEEAAGYYIDETGKTNTAFRLEKAVTEFKKRYVAGQSAELIVQKSGPFCPPFLVNRPLTIRGEGDTRPLLTVASTSCFEVVDSGTLNVSNIVFKGCTMPLDVSFINVNGGALTLDDGAELNGFEGRRDFGSGVVDLARGTATMKNGAVIANTKAHGHTYGNGYGGAIYVARNSDCTLNLAGGTITNCWARKSGGGVYLESWENKGLFPNVNLSGDLVLTDNTSANNTTGDDIYLSTYGCLSTFKLAGQIDGRVGILYSPSTAMSGNLKGSAFITKASGIVPNQTTLYSFFNDANKKMVAANGTGSEAGKLVWADDPRDPRQCREDEATAKLISNGTTSYWRDVSDALNEAPANSTVEVLRDATLATRVTVDKSKVTLRSAEGSIRTLDRARDMQITINAPGGLKIENLDFHGTADYSTRTFLNVNGGALSLNAVILTDIYGDGDRNANAITVYNHGTLDISGETQINTCINLTEDPSESGKTTNAGVGGGILVDGATAHFRDMTVSQCQATIGGGVFACNASTIHMSGATSINENRTPDFTHPSNLKLSDDSELILDGKVTGRIGMTHLEYSLRHPGMTNVVASISSDWHWDESSLIACATCFRRDVDSERAVPVANGTKALIVWCGALKNGRYTHPVDGLTYVLVGEMPISSPSAEALPQLQSGADVGLALLPLSDAAIRSHIETLSEYNQFRNWANSVAGGAEAVRDSDKAYVSYQFGSTELFENCPVIKITQAEPMEAGLTITVSVKDGEDAVAVAEDNVARMFEATSDLSDWNKTVELTVADPVQNGDKSVTFTVKPKDNPSAAYIRLAY